MDKKILTILILTVFMICISVNAADNNTTGDVIDLSDYITADGILNDEVMFSNGYNGFMIDSAKNEVSPMDDFTEASSDDEGISNYLKLAIIEAYKQGREDELGSIMKSFADSSYKSSSDKVIQNALKSDLTVNDGESVEINNTTEATFDFEVLKPVNESTSDYFAYTVSFKTVAKDNASDDTAKVDNKTSADTSKVNNKTSENTAKVENKTIKSDNKTSENTAKVENKTTKSDNKTSKTAKANNITNKTTPKDNNTEVHETNKTIINKTNTVIVNEKNTTIINRTNVKTVSNDTPENDTIATLMKQAGNPIFILIIVIIVILIVGVIYSRRN